MRLIDADKVLEYMTNEQKKRLGMMPIKGVMDSQPTVFDMDMKKELWDSLNEKLDRYNASSALRVCILGCVKKYFGHL